MSEAFSSHGKAAVRSDDLSLIEKLSKRAGRRLSYLGLPSPWMGDVLAWKPYLNRVFAVEKENLYLSHLMDTAYNLGLQNQTVYFLGDIDSILRSQTDDYGRTIDQIFPVDLVNLDYCGGLDYKEFSALSAIDALIERQRASLQDRKLSYNFPYFIILLTHNLPKHEGNPTAKEKYLNYLIRDSHLYEPTLKQQLDTVIKWYLSKECPAAYQHKCFVIGKLLEYAQANGFKIVPKKTIQYSGDKGAVMLHYQFQLTPINLRSPVPVDSKLNVISILNASVVDDTGVDMIPGRPKIILQKNRS